MSTPKKSTKLMLLVSNYGALILFLAISNPHDLSAIMLVIPILLLFSALFITMFWYVLRHSESTGLRRTAISALIAGVPSVLLLLRSMGQLSFKDILLMMVFAFVTFIYADRIRFYQKKQM